MEWILALIILEVAALSYVNYSKSIKDKFLAFPLTFIGTFLLWVFFIAGYAAELRFKSGEWFNDNGKTYECRYGKAYEVSSDTAYYKDGQHVSCTFKEG